MTFNTSWDRNGMPVERDDPREDRQARGECEIEAIENGADVLNMLLVWEIVFDPRTAEMEVRFWLEEFNSKCLTSGVMKALRETN